MHSYVCETEREREMNKEIQWFRYKSDSARNSSSTVQAPIIFLCVYWIRNWLHWMDKYETKEITSALPKEKVLQKKKKRRQIKEQTIAGAI